MAKRDRTCWAAASPRRQPTLGSGSLDHASSGLKGGGVERADHRSCSSVAAATSRSSRLGAVRFSTISDSKPREMSWIATTSRSTPRLNSGRVPMARIGEHRYSGQVEQDPGADDPEDHADAAEEVTWPTAIAGEHEYGEQVEEAADVPLESVLRLPMRAGSMMNRHLGYPVTEIVGQGRHISVQFAVQRNLLVDLPLSALKPQLWSRRRIPVASPVIQLKSLDGSRLDSGSRRSRFQPETRSLPPSRASRKRGISAGSSWRSASIVTMTSPWRRAHRTLRAAAFPSSAGDACPAELVLPRQSADRAPTAVGTPVVDEHQFERQIGPLCEDSLDFLGEDLERWLLVKGRHENAHVTSAHRLDPRTSWAGRGGGRGPEREAGFAFMKGPGENR